MDLSDCAAGLPGCNADMDLRYGMAASFPRLSQTRLVSNLASLRTRTLALQGNGADAARSVASSLPLLRVVDNASRC